MRKTGLIYATALALGSLMPMSGLEAYAQDKASKGDSNYSAPADTASSAGKSSELEQKAYSGSSDAKVENKKGPSYEFVPGKTRAEDVVRIYFGNNLEISDDEVNKTIEELKDVKGISYDDKGRYFLVSPEATKDRTYSIFRDAALLESINDDGNITKEEVEYVTKFSPRIFEMVLSGENKPIVESEDKKEVPKPERKEPVKYEDLGWFERIIVDGWMAVQKSRVEKNFELEFDESLGNLVKKFYGNKSQNDDNKK